MLIVAIVFFAIFTQAAAGFGLALVSMPLLVGLLGVRTATPLVALVGATAEIIVLARYRHAFNLRAVGRLSLASLAGIPLGLFVLHRVDTDIVTAFLGVVIVAYALYALLNLKLPQLLHGGWAYGFGFAGGVLSGAYNTSGPPVVMYGTCCCWRPAEFKSNLQGYFLLNSVMTIFAHGISGSFTPSVWQAYLLALPAILLGLVAGFSLDGRLDPQRFRQVVLVLLVFLGVRLFL